jgi:hypothetical protein
MDSKASSFRPVYKAVLAGDDYFADSSLLEKHVDAVLKIINSLPQIMNGANFDLLLVKENIKFVKAWLPRLGKISGMNVTVISECEISKSSGVRIDGVIILDQLDTNEGQVEVERIKSLAAGAGIPVVVKYF